MTQITTPKFGIKPELHYKVSEVAAFFGVDPKTVTRYVQAGLLGRGREEPGDEPEGWFRTPGGHRRFWGRVIIEAAERKYDPPIRPDLKEQL